VPAKPSSLDGLVIIDGVNVPTTSGTFTPP